MHTTPRSPLEASFDEDTVERVRGTPMELVEGIERDMMAMDLATQGFTYRRIAEKLGFSSPASCAAAIKRALSYTVAPHAETYRLVHFQRLEAMFNAVWDRLLTGDDAAIRTGLHILKRQAVLMGLDAPVRVDVKHIIQEYTKQFNMTEEETEQLFKAIQDDLAGARSQLPSNTGESENF